LQNYEKVSNYFTIPPCQHEDRCPGDILIVISICFEVLQVWMTMFLSDAGGLQSLERVLPTSQRKHFKQLVQENQMRRKKPENGIDDRAEPEQEENLSIRI